MCSVALRKALTSREIPESMRQLYVSSFPVDEQRPWESILAMADGAEPRYAVYIIEIDGREAGLMTVWSFPQCSYIEHLAVKEEMRGRGAGAQALRALAEATPLPLLVEVELPDANPMAARRIGFYRRCGFGELPYSYIQPPYTPAGRPVPLMLMATSPLPDPTETLHREVYKKYED